MADCAWGSGANGPPGPPPAAGGPGLCTWQPGRGSGKKEVHGPRGPDWAITPATAAQSMARAGPEKSLRSGLRKTAPPHDRRTWHRGRDTDRMGTRGGGHFWHQQAWTGERKVEGRHEGCLHCARPGVRMRAELGAEHHPGALLLWSSLLGTRGRRRWKHQKDCVTSAGRRGRC